MSKLSVKLDKEQREVLKKALSVALRDGELAEGREEAIAKEIVRMIEAADRMDDLRYEKERKCADEWIAEALECQAGMERPRKLAEGERLDSWAGVSTRKGERCLTLVAVNPASAHVVVRYLLPWEGVGELRDYLEKLEKNAVESRRRNRKGGPGNEQRIEAVR